MSNEQLRRFSVKSGITGLAQIRGRNNLSLSQKIKLDLFYVDNISLRVDLYIMLSTFRVILSNKQNIELGNKSLDNYEPNFFD
jgi:lipopolysaccharide/colanic/teichoic acid biosynthesis glycosyltransferase